MAKRTAKVTLPYGGTCPAPVRAFYTALVAAGAEFCRDCRQYVAPPTHICDPDVLLGNWHAGGQKIEGGAVTLTGALDEIDAEHANTEDDDA